MTGIRLALLAALAVLIPLAAGAQPIERLVGDWVSEDGTSRQQIVREFDGSWLETRMWFKDGDDWRLVARGAFYRQPGTDRWMGVTRATGMEGIELFESEVTPGAETFAVSNVAYKADGTSLKSEEEWRFASNDRIEYAIFEVTAEGRKPMYSGVWIRRPE